MSKNFRTTDHFSLWSQLYNNIGSLRQRPQLSVGREVPLDGPATLVISPGRWASPS